MARCLLGLCALLGATALWARDGFLDHSFSYRGWIDYGLIVDGQRAPAQNLRDATVDSSGRVVAIGQFQRAVGSANSDCVVLISSAGGRDIEALRELPLNRGGNQYDLCSSIEALPNGQFLITGYASTAGDRLTGIVARLNADGTLDTSYYSGGVFEVNAQIGWIDAAEITVLYESQRDAQGRMLMTGYFRQPAGTTQRGLILRFLADGTLDTGFGVDGAVPLADFNPPLITPSSIALDDAGRIYIAGVTQTPGLPRVGVIFRLLDDGSSDISFGGGMNGPGGNGGGGRGFVPRCDRVASIVLDASQRVLLGCEPDVSGSTPGPILAAGVLRLEVNGQPDTSFGGDGLVELLGWTSPMGSIAGPPRLALQSDGQIVVAANLSVIDQAGNESDLYTTRLDANGQPSGGYGYQGGGTYSRLRLADPQGPGSDSHAEYVNNLVLDPRGRALLVGRRSFTTQSAGLLIARLGAADPSVASGFLDPDFSSYGYRTYYFPEVPGPRTDTDGQDVAQDSSGRLTMIGRLRFDTNPSPSFLCTVMRTLSDGSADTTFAPPSGRRTLSLGASTFANVSLCRAVVALDDGTSLIAGVSGNSGTVIRLLADGSVDTDFFGNGVLETWTDLNLQVSGRLARFEDIAIDRQGRILVAGYTSGPGPSSANDLFGVVLRLNADLSVDTSFGENGMARLWTSTNPFRVTVDSIVEDASGRLYISGTEGSGADGNIGGVLYRLLADGSGDPSWPNGGYLRLRNTCDASYDVTVDAQQRPLFTCYPTSSSDVSVMRLLTGGQSDLNFGNGGIAAVRFIPPGIPAQGSTTGVRQILPLPDGKIAVVGAHQNAAGTGIENIYGFADIGVTRLLANGNPDLSFGRSNGANLFRLPDTYGKIEEFPAAALLQADGRIVITGSRYDFRTGAPPNNSTQLLMRVSNVLPPPIPNDTLFANGFQ